MKKMLLLVAAAVLGAAVAWAQLQITSFNSSGEISWTNSVSRGFYQIESAKSPTGLWNPVATVADLDWTKTNRITFQSPLTDPSAFYRAAWIPPDSIGDWEYRGYDRDLTLVITGRLSVLSARLLSSNPPVVYGLQGLWNLQYAGPPTNEVWYLAPQIGTGHFGGTIEIQTALFRLRWPTNAWDDNVSLFGDLWSNTYTGSWTYVTLVGPQSGTFTAERIATPNFNRSP